LLKNFYLIGNQRTIINEKKRKVQVVHDDEQQGTENTNDKRVNILFLNIY